MHRYARKCASFSIFQSERARNELAEKVKASENDKLTFEARLAEVAEVCFYKYH